ncbi:MAG: hypothetical protein LBB67_07360 [Oscillospiraceae bacterium]|nr:hypothetical protein [Oscillospiraceae bacterium]
MKKSLVFLVAIAMLFVTACSSTTNDVATTSVPDNIYNSPEVSWVIYDDAESLVDDADRVVIAKLSDISFTVLDSTTGLPPQEQSEAINCHLYTVYLADILTNYKGTNVEKLKIVTFGGLKDYRVEEQLALSSQTEESNTILILTEMPQLEIGDVCLFTLLQTEDSDFAHMMPPDQAIYNLTQESPLTQHPNMTAKDIILTFGEDKWQDFWAQWQAEHPDYQELTTTIYD